ncbi:hypothetical protein C8A01DRAFT_42025 [Parachaetomium inaequale]|uniref:PAS fold-2 domain-containing protein n=1 Tax=Parachaetomium inaequale TaxID=2588326 RepID=A0AAN6P4M8_9PEZI|nr:hypothetical protein C8A01DRAFT_42025 [Parachaetomium inaequale]
MATNMNFENTKELLTKCRANVDVAMALFEQGLEPSDLGNLGVPVPAVLAALASDKAAAEADLAARVKKFEERVQAFEEEKRVFQQQHDVGKISLTLWALNEKMDKVIRSSENTTAMLGQDGPVVQALKAQQQVSGTAKATSSTAEVSCQTLAKQVKDGETTLAKVVHEASENAGRSFNAVADRLQHVANEITQGVADMRSATAITSETESSKDAMLDSIKEICDVMM